MVPRPSTRTRGDLHATESCNARHDRRGRRLDHSRDLGTGRIDSRPGGRQVDRHHRSAVGTSHPEEQAQRDPQGGVTATVDFNPVADRLRIMGSDGTSLRVNVDDGKATVDGSHKFKEGDGNAGKTPKIVAGAYSNAVKGTQSTTLYNIDAATGSLVTQAPPNDGVLNTVGSLGIKLDGAVGFNIVSSATDKNEAWLTMGGALYAVDLKTG